VPILEKEMASTQFTRTEKVTRTRLIELLTGAKDNIFAVTFRTQVKADEVCDKLKEANINTSDARALKKLATSLLEGHEVTRVAHLAHTENLLGRSLAINLQVADKNKAFMQIDHRTLLAITINNVRYELK